MEVTRLLTRFRKRFFSYQPLVEVLIYKKNLENNFLVFQNFVTNNVVAPVLKSNAYGHGLVEIAKIIDPLKPPFIVVDSIFEAQTLRAAKIKSTILIVGFTPVENILHNSLKDIQFTVSSLELLRKLVKNCRKKTIIQIKFDTGMHRQGILPEELAEVKKTLTSHPNITVNGVLSHLADAENPNSELTDNQIKKWNNLVPKFKDLFPKTVYWHLAATAGTAWLNQIDSNIVRLGLGLYGFAPSSHPLAKKLKPAMEVNTLITSLKYIESGETVGYSGSFKAENITRLATVPMGYFEGIDRRLSNTGFVKIKNLFAKFAGNVSMNIASIDVTQIKGLKLGDKVQVYSTNPTDANSFEKAAGQIKTIIYELLVHIPAHLRRTVV